MSDNFSSISGLVWPEKYFGIIFEDMPPSAYAAMRNGIVNGEGSFSPFNDHFGSRLEVHREIKTFDSDNFIVVKRMVDHIEWSGCLFRILYSYELRRTVRAVYNSKLALTSMSLTKLAEPIPESYICESRLICITLLEWCTD